MSSIITQILNSFGSSSKSSLEKEVKSENRALDKSSPILNEKSNLTEYSTKNWFSKKAFINSLPHPNKKSRYTSNTLAAV